MSNSLNFLNKPASTPKPAPIGPQPKPSTAAPKAFIDKANPWAVGGGTPTASAKTPAPRTQTPARTQQRAAIPSRGYNYTDASYTGATPQQRAREVDQAQMAAQATRQRRERERAQAQAAAQQAIAPVQARGYVDPYLAQQQRGFPTPQPTQQPRIDPYLAQQQGLAQPTPAPASPWQMAPTAEQAMAMRPMGQPTPAPTPAQPWQMAPTAEQALAMRPPQAPAARANIPATGYNYTNAPPGMTAPTPQPITGTNVPTAPGAPNAPAAGNAQPQARGPFYGYAPPGPLTAARPYTPQRGQRDPYMTDRPNVSGWGQRALMTDEALAVEDARRQRDQAGSFGALQLSGTFRPWSSYSPAEKYYLRYGVMPQGEQMPPDYSGIEAMAQSRAQTERLKGQYVDLYGRYPRWDGYRVNDPNATQVAAWQASPERAKYLEAQGITPAAPATQATPAAPGAQAQINNAALAQVNPAAVRNGVITNAVMENDVSVVARQILQRYRPELAVDGMNLVDIAAILAQYIPPQDRAAMYNEDAQWLGGFLSR